MVRPKKNNHIRQEMCARFVKTIESLNLNASEASRALGYANSTTILKVRRGQAFVDVERLYLLAQIGEEGGQPVDLNWLICGKAIDGRLEPGVALLRTEKEIDDE